MTIDLRKLNICLFALAVSVLLLGIAPAVSAEEIGGDCGDDLSWSLSGDTLTITGTGAMDDFPERTMSPWYEYREQISRVKLPDGLTRVGDLAFYQCTALKTVSLPDTVTEVGWHAFDGCSGLVMLDLGEGLAVIEEAGFRSCTSLSSVRLPDSLTTMEFQAFYRCESLTEITIPSSVTELGMTTFAYCYELVRADVYADITTLPDWTFYGCARLTDVTLPSSLKSANEYAFYECTGLANVSYSGSKTNKEQIKSDIDRDLLGKAGLVTLSENKNSGSTSNSVFEEKGSDIVSKTTITTRTDNAHISSNVTVTYPLADVENSTSSAQVNVTLENASGWSEASGELMSIVGQADSTKVDVYTKNESVIPGGVLDSLAGQNATVTVHTASDSAWQMDCSIMQVSTTEDDDEKEEQEYDLSYERSDATEAQTKLLSGAVGYQISFSKDAIINAAVMIKLPVTHARQTASLYQVHRGDLQHLQSAVVDDAGYACFYLASVSSKTEYLVGINVSASESEAAIVPKSLYADYGITDTFGQVEYVVTGRTSSWGMNIGQVTWIMVGVLTLCVVGVGFTMYLLNKRKLKSGYVPDISDEDMQTLK